MTTPDQRRSRRKYIYPEGSDYYFFKLFLADINKTYVNEIKKEGYQPTMKQLIAQGKIKEAIDVFEEDFPEEAILLLARFNQAERNRSLAILSKEDWSVEMQKIADSLLKLSQTSE